MEKPIIHFILISQEEICVHGTSYTRHEIALIQHESFNGVLYFKNCHVREPTEPLYDSRIKVNAIPKWSCKFLKDFSYSACTFEPEIPQCGLSEGEFARGLRTGCFIVRTPLFTQLIFQIAQGRRRVTLLLPFALFSELRWSTVRALN